MSDSQDDQDVAKTADGDNFSFDTGADSSNGRGSDYDEGSIYRLVELNEEGLFNEIFELEKLEKINEKSALEINLLIKRLILEFAFAFDEDAMLNTGGKPAINKLEKLPLITEVVSKKQFHHTLLDNGLLLLLAMWLKLLPDGNLPSVQIREAILRILTYFPLDLKQHGVREHLKVSGLEEHIMSLSMSDQETITNKKLATDLLDKWASDNMHETGP